MKIKSYYWMARSWWDDSIFPSAEKEPYCRRAAWAYLVGVAHWADDPKEVNASGNIIIVNRGELTFSIRYLARAWGWTPSKTQRFIDGLKKHRKIDTRTDTGQLVITLCNYIENQDAVSKKIQQPIQDRYSTDTNIKQTKQIKQDNYIPPKSSSGDLFGHSKYAFEGETIKLDHKTFDSFKSAYYAIPDLNAILFSEDFFLTNDEAGMKRAKGWYMYINNRCKQLHLQALPAFEEKQKMEKRSESVGFTSYDPTYAKPRSVN